MARRLEIHRVCKFYSLSNGERKFPIFFQTCKYNLKVCNSIFFLRYYRKIVEYDLVSNHFLQNTRSPWLRIKQNLVIQLQIKVIYNLVNKFEQIYTIL